MVRNEHVIRAESPHKPRGEDDVYPSPSIATVRLVENRVADAVASQNFTASFLQWTYRHTIAALTESDTASTVMTVVPG